MVRANFCAIDFGTSNSALAYSACDPAGDPAGATMVLAQLEGEATGMPTAVFYNADDGTALYGRAAIEAYVDGVDGRLLRSIKSILGSDLMDEATEIGQGRSVQYLDVVVSYLRHVRTVAGQQAGQPLTRAVLGRPVFFVDDDPVRDRRAQDTLAQAALHAGFTEVSFQYEPIAAALDFEARLPREEMLVLVADIGGGTSDFSILRARRSRHAPAHLRAHMRADAQRDQERRDDVLANHGVHVAGTDFDRAINLAAFMPLLGLGSCTPQGNAVPNRIYFDLATWHLINTTYAPLRLAQLRQARPMYADQVAFERMLHVLRHRLGHLLAGRAEQAKITTALHGMATVPLDEIAPLLAMTLDARQQAESLQAWFDRIVQAALQTCRLAQVAPQAIEAIYFTGGSTGLAPLRAALAAQFSQAQEIEGDRFASVVQGLAITAQRRYGTALQ
jgi:hypothetical chaperone protein